MIDLKTLEKQFIASHIKPGGIAVDCTMGNGHDTLWLCNAIGNEGHVYSFDIQNQAIENTKRLLMESNCPNNYTLIQSSHEFIRDYISSPICAAVFNLGYLPGGDKSITTLRRSTAIAVTSAIDLLDDDGIVLIAVYPGHEEGNLEGQMLDDMLHQYDRKQICVSRFQIINSPTSPYFYAIEKK